MKSCKGTGLSCSHNWRWMVHWNRVKMLARWVLLEVFLLEACDSLNFHDHNVGSFALGGRCMPRKISCCFPVLQQWLYSWKYQTLTETGLGWEWRECGLRIHKLCFVWLEVIFTSCHTFFPSSTQHSRCFGCKWQDLISLLLLAQFAFCYETVIFSTWCIRLSEKE